VGGGFEEQFTPAAGAWSAGFGYCKLNLANSHNSVLISLTIALCRLHCSFVVVAFAWHENKSGEKRGFFWGWREREKIFAHVRKSFLVDSIFSFKFSSAR